MQRIIIFLIGIILLGVFITPLNAQNIAPIENFNYGILVIKNNDAVYSMRIRQGGTLDAVSPQFIPISGQMPATLQFTGFPASTQLNISFTSPVTLSGASGNFFTVTNFELPANTNTDGDGNRTMDIGSTLQTSGNGLAYADEPYTGSLTILVTY